MKNRFEFSLFEKKIIVEIGEIAQRANGSALIKFGDTVILSSFCCSENERDVDFFPLLVNYEEKFYADSRMPNTFNRREGKASEREILISRILDRSIRSMFNNDFRNETQIINLVMSYDYDCATEVASLLGSSLSICISEIPFNGPVSGVFVGKIDGELVINPGLEERKKSSINLFISGNESGINMIEGDLNEINENDVIEALELAHKSIKELCKFQKEIIKKIGKKKKEFLFNIDKEIEDNIYKKVKNDLSKVFLNNEGFSKNVLDDIKKSVIEKYEQKNFKDDLEKKHFFLMVNNILERIISNEIRDKIFNEKIRLDGRKLEEIRDLKADINILPRVHGSGLFFRGETQVISATTLAPLSEKQTIDNLSEETERFFMHQYNFHPFSVGEISNISVGRREIGHGSLGEKSLKHIIPTIQEFPFSIRTVSEVLSSNGSSSQASICASCLSLINAGVPIKNIISGISVGLITKKDFDINNVKKDDYIFLTDIQDLEDHYGDMDFKVSGTCNGITALQLDLKIPSITINMLKEAIQTAIKSCSKIRVFIQETISKQETTINPKTLKVKNICIPQEKIRDIIGINRKNINEIISKSDNCKIFIKDDGRIYIYHNDDNLINKAILLIKNFVNVDAQINFNIGDKFNMTIDHIEKYGVSGFLENTNIKVFCHIRELDKKYISNIFDEYHIGDIIEVVITKIEKETGNIEISRKKLLN